MKQYSSSGPGGRNQVTNRASSGAVMGEHAEGAAFDSLIGRRVRTRWPDDNNFYEAVITDYNSAEVLTALNKEAQIHTFCCFIDIGVGHRVYVHASYACPCATIFSFLFLILFCFINFLLKYFAVLKCSYPILKC